VHILTVTLLVISVAVFSVSFFNLPDTTFGITDYGSVSPSIPIKRDGNVYTFANNTPKFTIRRSNIVIDGNGYNSSLIILDHATNVTIKNLQLIASSGMYYKYSGIGLYLDYSSNNLISNCCLLGATISLHAAHNNTISNNTNLRVYLDHSNYNTISNNDLTGSRVAESVNIRNGANNLILRNNSTKIVLSPSASSNLIFGNRINNANWIFLHIGPESTKNLFVGNEIVGPFVVQSSINSPDNLFYHNNFIDAWSAEYNPLENNATNKWNTTNEGNYWNDYLGEDLNHDGIGDTPYIINAFNQDNYPLMNPINIAQEPQPNQNLYAADIDSAQTATTTFTVIVFLVILVMLAIGVGLYKGKKLSPKKSLELAAVASILSGALLIGAFYYGFGSYMTFPYYRGGWATSGNINRFSLVFLSALAISIMLTGLGFRMIAKTKKDPYATLKLLPVLLASAALLSAAGLLTTAHPYYAGPEEGLYWAGCIFTETNDSITFTHLTIIAFVLLGVCQALWGGIQLKQNGYNKNFPRKLGLFQVLLGIACILMALSLYMSFIFSFGGAPSISLAFPLMFMIGQTLSAVFFISQKNPEIN